MLSFQNCGPTNGFSTKELSEKSSFSSTLPDAPQFPDPSMKPCGDVLAPGESCSLAIQFTPTAAGTRNGSLQIVADGQILGEVALTGEGQ